MKIICYLPNSALILSTASVLVTSYNAAAQFFFPFNSDQELTQNFHETPVYSETNFFFSSAAGVGGLSGRINLSFPPSQETLIFNTPGYFDGGVSPNISAYFYYTHPNFVSNTNLGIFSAGLVNGPTNGLSNRREEYASIAGGIVSNPAGDQQQLGHWSTLNRTVSESLSPVFSMDEGWYQLSVSHQLADINLFDYTVSLTAWGPNGTASPFTLAVINGQASNSGIFQASNVYFGLLGFSGEYGIQAVDNISIAVPEPSSLSLFCFSGLILGAHLIGRAKVRTRV